ncbi:MAG TPA: polysaccharide biosynthesis/export family protein [Syntrophorhabdales bacterium]|nr:polysaccharide biosynthesis/export family protein [Syntrophorhabdales bacterium]
MKTALVFSIFLLVTVSCTWTWVEHPSPKEPLDKQAQLYPAQEYKIQYGDQLDIKFLYNPELNENLPVRPDGRITLQLVGDLMVVDMTPTQLAEALKTRYAAEIRKPEITVIVRQFAAQKVFVDGEVGRPGLLQLVGPMKVSQAIAQSGGFGYDARKKEVVVIRQNPAGKPLVTVVNLDDVQHGIEMANDINLMPYDMVFVPKSPIGEVDKWVAQYIRNLLPFPIPSPIPTPTTTTGSWF